MKNKDESYSNEYYMIRELMVSEVVHAARLRDCKNMEDVWVEGDRYSRVLRGMFRTFFERNEDGE